MRIINASNLDELLSQLEDVEMFAASLEEALWDVVDVTHLPTFGGEPPSNRQGAYSWDESRCLLLHPRLCLVNRCYTC